MKQVFKVLLAFLAVTLCMEVGVIAAAPTLTNPQVRLWYQETGRLSGNIAPPKTINLWNTCIGEGDAQEIANDVLFTIDIRSSGQRVNTPITLVATGANGRAIARRTYSGVLTNERGAATLALWVPEVGCGGRVVFSAGMGAQSRSVTLDFNSGE